VVVVDSRQRRDQIIERLVVAGYEPVPAANADEASRLSDELDPAVIVADDLEPTRHLPRIADRRGGKSCPLVLISGGRRDPAAESARAGRLGALDAWCEPWRSDDLTRILQRRDGP
jgi:hypothetical protein